MLIPSNHLLAMPLARMGWGARPSTCIQAPAEVFGPARPEDFQGLYGGPVFGA
ncbi:MAG: hypothetical protein ACOX9B_09820 [Candidatus Xenobium sp.]|jgi:hypothetical protein|nr:hypothetical protein [Burkholderiales bacterium]